MFQDYGYQLYQAQRTVTRAEIIADDERLGRQAAAITRGFLRIRRFTSPRRNPAPRRPGEARGLA